MKKIILFFSLFSVTICSAQEDSIEKGTLINTVITMSILTPGVSYAPRWTFGVIQRVSPKILIGSDFGFGTEKTIVTLINDNPDLYKNYKSFEVRPEVYFDIFPEKGKKVKALLSFDLDYVHHQSQMLNSWYRDDSGRYSFTSADYDRKRYGADVNFNLVITPIKNLVLLPKLGIGLKKREVVFSNIIDKVSEEETILSNMFDSQKARALHWNGNHFSGSINLDFKIGYNF